MFFALFFSMFAELVLFFVVWKFDLGGLLFVSVLPFCTFSPIFCLVAARQRSVARMPWQ
jgi:hypothetical protein